MIVLIKDWCGASAAQLAAAKYRDGQQIECLLDSEVWGIAEQLFSHGLAVLVKDMTGKNEPVRKIIVGVDTKFFQSR